MTTLPEIKRWTKPVLAGRSDLVLRGRSIFLRPTHHIVRCIFFQGSSDKNYPRPRWYFSIPFAPPSGLARALWSAELPVWHSTDEGFAQKVVEQFTQKIDQDLKPVSSIEAFYEMTLDDRSTEAGTGYWQLAKYPVFHAPVLAALGRLDEAQVVVNSFVAAKESNLLIKLERGQTLVAKRANSAIGRIYIKYATFDLNMLSELKRLSVLAAAGDRIGVGALLREWEIEMIKWWGIEDLWEPTPFPVELGAGR